MIYLISLYNNNKVIHHMKVKKTKAFLNIPRTVYRF